MSVLREARGSHLLDAVLEVVAEQGLQAASMRSVAAAAGVSLAQVQYYFSSKAGLVQAAYERANAEFLETMEGIEAVPGPAELRAVVELWLPLDEERDRRARVWLAYAAAAANDERLGREYSRLDREVRIWLTARFVVLAQAGHLVQRRPPPASASMLLALIDGMTVASLTLSFPARRRLAEESVFAWLDEQSRPCGTTRTVGAT